MRYHRRLPALLSALLLSAAAFDGEAALRHAAALAALGPHPWGSPRAGAAAQYVAAELRAAGLRDVTVQAFASHGRRGANVVAVLPGESPERVIVGAHHDTAPDAPGAYDDGGGVGVLIETARVLARERTRARTLVFVSFDGEEAWFTGRTRVAGSREYVRALGPRARDVAAAFVIEMCGWAGGTPALHPIPYPDPLRPGAFVVSPAWVVAAAQRGARAAGAPFVVGDPLLSWLYQPAVRTVRATLYGDDLALLEAGVPAVLASDSSFTAFYPWYHLPADTPDKLDAAALERMGRAVVAAVRALLVAPRGPARQPHWFAAHGGTIGVAWLYALGAASLVPRLVRVANSRRVPAGLVLQAALFVVLLFRHPVVTLWVFLLPNLLAGARGALVFALALFPLGALVALCLVAWMRGFASGLWIAPWEMLSAAAALALLRLTAGAP
ncbi:MAG TPA: M28 family peptidase, partial [Vicinamibacteria bacterium]|nr:M28 family peptidase [Vicinamibacteria bacterium]